MKITKQTFNAVCIVLGIALVILLALTFYNYSQSGKFNFTNLIVTGLIILTMIVARRSVNVER